MPDDTSATVTIRRAEPGDFEAVQRIYQYPRAMRGTLQMPFPSAEMWRKRLAEWPESGFNLLACVEGDVVGQLGLHFPHSPRRRHAGQIGMAVRDDWQGRGIGTRLMHEAVDIADRWLNLTRLELEVYTDNEPGLRLYRKFGFEVEGTMRRYAFRDGEYVDAHLMARLRES